MVLIEKAYDRSDRGAHADICRLVTADGFWSVGGGVKYLRYSETYLPANGN